MIPAKLVYVCLDSHARPAIQTISCSRLIHQQIVRTHCPCFWVPVWFVSDHYLEWALVDTLEHSGFRHSSIFQTKGAAPPNAAPRAAPWKIIFSQLSFRGAACSGAPAMINIKVYLCLTHRAARRGAAQRGVWWGRSLRVICPKLG